VGRIPNVLLVGFVLVPHDNTHFLGSSIWQNRVLLRVALLAWSAALGKILTWDNLKK
jgi:hypothetical protein